MNTLQTLPESPHNKGNDAPLPVRGDGDEAMKNESLKQRTAKGLVWGGLASGTVQLLNALFGLVLLNKLSQEDYGMIAVLVVFSNVAGCLQESGFTAALANKKPARHEDYNAVFWFSVIIGAALYGLLFATAPLIADFYHEPKLLPLSRFVFLNFFITSIGSTHYAYMFSNLMVKQNSIINVTALLVSGIVGIVLAFAHFSYWALAVQNITYVTVTLLLRWYYSPWRPTLQLDLRPAWKMWGFSWKLLVQNLFLQLNVNVFAVLLGHFYTKRVAGIFAAARKWDDMAVATISGMVQGVAQPTFTQVDSTLSGREGGGEAAPLRAVFRKMLRFTCFLSFPCLFGMSLISEDFIHCLMPKWHQSAPLLSILCLYGAFAPVTTLYSNLVISRGRSTVNLLNTVTLCILIWIGLIALHHRGVQTMTWYYVLVNTAWLAVWQWWARRLIGLRFLHAALDIMPFLIYSASVIAATWWLTSGMQAGWLRLAAKILTAIILYIGLLWISRAKILQESIGYITHTHRHEGKKSTGMA